jgi:hypothetical protein
VIHSVDSLYLAVSVCACVWHLSIPSHKRANENEQTNENENENEPTNQRTNSSLLAATQHARTMKFSLSVISALLLADYASAFTTHSSLLKSSSSHLYMAAMPAPAAPVAAIEQQEPAPSYYSGGQQQPVDVRYSDFIKLVDSNRIEKVTFSADGTQLLGMDVDGSRLKIMALPNDPALLTQLTSHKVDVTVLPAQEASGVGELLQSLLFPALLFAGLFFFSRRAGGAGGGPGNPMGFGKSKSQIQMVPDTGITFDDVAGCDGAKAELVEVVDFLKQPEAYTKMGCKIPRGVILDGTVTVSSLSLSLYDGWRESCSLPFSLSFLQVLLEREKHSWPRP